MNNIYYFTMVEENFEIWPPEMLQIDSILLLCVLHYFTMVEEKFEFDLKCLRLTQFYYFLSYITSPWLKKILKFDLLKCSRLTQFYYFLSPYITSPWMKKILKFDLWNAPDWHNFTTLIALLHHGWRKFSILTFWNASDWLNFTIFYLTLLHHGWRKFLNLTSEMLQIDSILLLWVHLLTMVDFFFAFWPSEIPQIDSILLFLNSYQEIDQKTGFYKKYPKTGGKQENSTGPPKNRKNRASGDIGMYMVKDGHVEKN